MHPSFPFLFDCVHGGLTVVSGVCHCEQNEVVFEFRYDIGGLGLKSPPKEATLSFHEIDRCLFWKSWFGAGVRIHTKRMQYLERFPSHEEDHLNLRVRRRDRDRAEWVASEIDLRAAEANRAAR